MPNSRRERTITVSGLKGYFQLLPEEQKAFRCEIFFSATNVGLTNYYSYEWYKERTLYGRYKIARGEYTTREKLLQYQNELIYAEEATLNEIVKRLQCSLQKQYEVNKFMVEATIKVAAALSVVTGFGSSSTAFDQIPPQPINIPGLQIDGVYYNMFPGCAGKITIQTWYDDDICLDVNGQPLTKDNRGKPPEPASAGKPPAGSDSNVPLPTFPPSSTYADPNPSQDTPTDQLDNPNVPNGYVGTLYTLRYRDYFTSSGETRANVVTTIVGQYSGLITGTDQGGARKFRGLFTNIGSASNPTGVFMELQSFGNSVGYPDAVSIDGFSITPQ